MGCSLGLAPRPSSGLISAFSGSRYEISAPILPGNSGGGVFLKATRELIGIVVWVRVYHGQLVTTAAGVVPLQEIYSFLEEASLVHQFTSSRVKTSKHMNTLTRNYRTVNQGGWHREVSRNGVPRWGTGAFD